MSNSFSHIRYLVKNILLSAGFLFFSCSSYAQDEYPDSLTHLDIPSYYPYPIHDSVLSNLKKDDAFWYADKVPKRQKPEEINFKDYKEPFYAQNWFRTLLWVIIISAFIAV